MRQPSSSREVRERDWEGKFTFNIVKSYCSHSLWRRVSLWGRRRRKNCKYTFHDDDSHERREWNETRGSIKSLLRRNVVLKWRSCNDLWFETQAWITRGRERNFYSVVVVWRDERRRREDSGKSHDSFSATQKIIRDGRCCCPESSSMTDRRREKERKPNDREQEKVIPCLMVDYRE